MPIQTTVRDFLNSAAVAARMISPGMSISGNQLQVWLDGFADLARTWSVDRQFGFFIPDVPYTLPAAQESYDIGPTATNYNTTANPALVRPLFIESARAAVGVAPYRRWPLNILTEQQFASVPGRGITDPNGPLNIYYAAGLQNGTFNFAPLGVNNQIIYVSQWNPFKTFAITDLALYMETFYPEEYIRALKLSLAVEVISKYSLQSPPELISNAQTAVGTVRDLNKGRLTGALGQSSTLAAPSIGAGVPQATPNTPQQ